MDTPMPRITPCLMASIFPKSRSLGESPPWVFISPVINCRVAESCSGASMVRRHMSAQGTDLPARGWSVGFQVTGGRFYAFHPGQDCQGNPAVRQQGDDFGPEADCEADLQFRKGLAGFLEHGGELVDPDAVGGAEIQGFPAGLACRGQLLLKPGVAIQAGDGVGVGFLPAVVEHQAAALAVEQAAVQLALQGVDLFGEGGLRAEQLFRGPHLRAFLGQGPQGQQFIHIHCVTPFKL